MNAPLPAPQPEFVARLRAARYLLSVNQLRQLPPDGGAEVAFAGRSNAGKSSGLNTITGQKNLARISKTPGRTQLINFFALADDQYLVDLPGYGYAKVPDAVRRHWQTLLQRYLSRRRALRGLLLFMDVRHPLTPLDRQLLDWCESRGLAGHCLLTKADKLKRGPALAALRQVRSELGRSYRHARAELFSARTGQGVDAARSRLEGWLNTPGEP